MSNKLRYTQYCRRQPCICALYMCMKDGAQPTPLPVALCVSYVYNYANVGYGLDSL